MMFVYTALDASGQQSTEGLEAVDLNEAKQELMRRGLHVLNLAPARRRTDVRQLTDPIRAVSTSSSHSQATPAARLPELVLFARQMSMMLRSGASIVPAIQALNEQPGRPAWHALLTDLAERVEGGASLNEAMTAHPKYFPGAVRSLIAAGEATGTLAESFGRLNVLLESQQRIRKKLISALVYPCMLLLMALGVVITMTTFVAPRFASLFEMLETPLPAMTRVLLDTGIWLQTWWFIPLAVVGGSGAAAWVGLRSDGGRRTVGRICIRLPLIGKTLIGVTLSRLLLMWAALLRSHVSLLDAVTQSHALTGNVTFRKMLTDIETAVTEGRLMSEVMKQSGIVPAPVVSAIATGEESGKLGESMEFVGTWLDQENKILINAITRAMEPAILIVMGLIVGTICVALFLPLFDIATAA